MEKFIIKAKPDKNCLYFVLQGFFLESELQLAKIVVDFELEKLHENFSAIIEDYHVKCSIPDYKAKLSEIKKSIFSRNPEKVIYIHEKADAFKYAFRFFNYNYKFHSGKTIVASSLESAETILENRKCRILPI